MTRSRIQRSAAKTAAVLVALVVAGLAGCSSSGSPIAEAGISDLDVPQVTTHPNRTLISYGGQFMSSCRFSHNLADDPIMHRGHPGASHLHEFFGSIVTDATSTYDSMIDQPSTCSDDGDRSAYWVPALFIDGERIEPRRVDAYYRVAHGVVPTEVQPYPDGLEILSGNQHATESGSLEVAAWTCGLSPQLSPEPPKDCTPDRPVQLRLTYPSCWDGEHIRTDDHTSHMAYPSPKTGCDAQHPVAVPQLTLTVHYPFSGDYATGRLASGDFITAHGDFLAAWQHKRITDQVSGCLRRQITCGIVGGTFHTGRGSRDINSYNLQPQNQSPTTLPIYDGGVTTTTRPMTAMEQSEH